MSHTAPFAGKKDALQKIFEKINCDF